MDAHTHDAIWTDVAAIDVLENKDRHVLKVGDKQILIFKDGEQIRACNNRCPHEGYPLSEGNISDGCILTCNWHNWKFDLSTGETLIGGDSLRLYPAKIDADRIWIDISGPPVEQIIDDALESLSDCFKEDYEYDRMAREIARIERAGGSALQALYHTIKTTHDHFEYGMTHAVAAGADWLRLYQDNVDDPARRLAAVVEVIGNLAWDSRRMPRFPFTSDSQVFDADEFLKAIESEDEVTAVALIRGALKEGLRFNELYEPLARAALAHYQGFGHSLIYVNKAKEFVERAGDDVLEPVLLMLVRSHVYENREDLIPEFKSYRPALQSTPDQKSPIDADVIRSQGVAQVLEQISQSDATYEDTYHKLMEAAAWQLLHIDLSYAEKISGPIQDNVGWLNVTHTVTFANAVRTTCQLVPDLWRAGLLQIGCFLGRNAKFMDKSISYDEWSVSDPFKFASDSRQNALHHGEAEYIVVAHIVKLSTAIHDEIKASPNAPWVGMLAAALNRFLHSPLRRKNPIKTANQALEMVKREG